MTSSEFKNPIEFFLNKNIFLQKFISDFNNIEYDERAIDCLQLYIKDFSFEKLYHFAYLTKKNSFDDLYKFRLKFSFEPSIKQLNLEQFNFNKIDANNNTISFMFRNDNVVINYQFPNLRGTPVITIDLKNKIINCTDESAFRNYRGDKNTDFFFNIIEQYKKTLLPILIENNNDLYNALFFNIPIPQTKVDFYSLVHDIDISNNNPLLKLLTTDIAKIDFNKNTLKPKP